MDSGTSSVGLSSILTGFRMDLDLFMTPASWQAVRQHMVQPGSVHNLFKLGIGNFTCFRRTSTGYSSWKHPSLHINLTKKGGHRWTTAEAASTTNHRTPPHKSSSPISSIFACCHQVSWPKKSQLNSEILTLPCF